MLLHRIEVKGQGVRSKFTGDWSDRLAKPVMALSLKSRLKMETEWKSGSQRSTKSLLNWLVQAQARALKKSL